MNTSSALKAGLLAVTCGVFVMAGPALAGRPCEDGKPTVDQIRRGMNLAQATAAALDRSGADVVLLARAGQDLSEYGLRWSHVGFVYRETAGSGTDAKPVWRVVHKLNQCGTALSDLYRQGLGEFFLDNPHRYEAAFSVLKPELQQALLPVLRENARAAALHTPDYNMVAYPWSRQYQQSNQWALETLAAAAAPREVHNRAQAQDWLQRQGYQPSDLRLSTAKRLGARIGMANVAFDDHPSAKRFAGHIETTTADTVFNWLTRSGYGQVPQSVKAAP
jgi:hypothetical protein